MRYALAAIYLFILAVLCVCSCPVWANEYHGLVVSIHDGDTLTLLRDDQQQMTIRLACIDAPELDQPYGKRAKQALARLTYRKWVVVTVEKRDRYRRYLGTVILPESVEANTALVERGAAWVYRRYCHDQKLLGFETTARRKRIGLWRLPTSEGLPPWKWRKAKVVQKH